MNIVRSPQLPKRLFFGALAAIGTGAAIAVGAVLYVTASDMPSLEQLENPKSEFATVVLSEDGDVLDHFYIKRRTYVPLDSIPKAYVDALIATEDRAFYDHWGIHSMRLVKAIVKNVLYGKLEGASTITQQLARNLFLSMEQTLTRKIREAITSIEIERRYTKDEILEMYANTVYYGRGAYGIKVAADTYFGKKPLDLTPAECAFLVGVLKSPSGFDPDKRYERALRRRNLVLAMMYQQGYLPTKTYEENVKSAIVTTDKQDLLLTSSIAPHFVELIRQQLQDDPRLAGLDLYKDGLIITTTIDSRMQRYANEAVQKHIEEFSPTFNNSWSWTKNAELRTSILEKSVRQSKAWKTADSSDRPGVRKKLLSSQAFVDSVLTDALKIQAGFVAIENGTGKVRAMVGSSVVGPQAKGTLNHVTQIRRQPGSVFKPFVYTAALENTATPETVVEAGSFSYKLPEGTVWSLAARKQDTTGPITLRTALKYSVNTVAARLITQYTTPDRVIDVARRMGITSPLKPFPSIALGAQEVSPFEITSAFSTFANNGIYAKPWMIVRIEDRYGNVLFDAKGPEEFRNSLSEKVAHDMLSMMQGTVTGGTGWRVRNFYTGEAAGKTGTTNDYGDAWFVGATPRLTAGVWIGFDDNRIKFTGWYGQGGTAAAPVFGRFMGATYADSSIGYQLQETFKSVLEDTSAVDSSQAFPNEEPPSYPANTEPSATPPEPDQEDEPVEDPQALPPQEEMARKVSRLPSLRKNDSAAAPRR